MKRITSSILAISVGALVLSAGAFAQAGDQSAKAEIKSKKAAKHSTKKGGSNVSRDVVFDGSVINGKYLAAGEAVSTVESEKTLNNLIGLRTDFKDRLAGERQRLKRGTQGEK